MRISAILLGVALLLLQYRLWVSDQGTREVSRLQAAADAQSAANREQRDRNRQLVAEVADLKGGMTALEERARSELGMVGSSETFYQVVTLDKTQPTPIPPAQPGALTHRAVTARTQ